MSMEGAVLGQSALTGLVASLCACLLNTGCRMICRDMGIKRAERKMRVVDSDDI
jgi:hypothetical protein